MMARRIFLVALALAGAACDDDTTAPAAADMTAAAPDLSGGGTKSCGVDGVRLSCASVSGGVSCYVCDYASSGGGRCAKPCLLSAPTCPTGQQCHEFSSDGGTQFAV